MYRFFILFVVNFFFEYFITLFTVAIQIYCLCLLL